METKTQKLKEEILLKFSDLFRSHVNGFTTKHSLFSARVLGFWTFSLKEKSFCIIISLTFDRCPPNFCCFHVWTEITSACCLVSEPFQDTPHLSQEWDHLQRVHLVSETPVGIRWSFLHYVLVEQVGGAAGVRNEQPGTSVNEKCVCIRREKVLQHDNLAKKTYK